MTKSSTRAANYPRMLRRRPSSKVISIPYRRPEREDQQTLHRWPCTLSQLMA